MGRLLLAAAAATLPTAAVAETNHFEVWFNPAVTKSVSDKTELEFETAQRFRDAGEGGRDTYFFRLWVNHELSKNLVLSGGVEQRFNDSQEEQRLLQQLEFKSGIVRLRGRLEQRFVEGEQRMALRYRQRVGIKAYLDAEKRWSFAANTEPFVTLRAGNPGAQTGLTAVRSIVQFGRKFGPNLEVTAGYLNQADIRKNRPDRLGHAPLIGLTLGL